MTQTTTEQAIQHVYDDGGRAAAGFRGNAGDCVVRAIAIVEQRPYLEIYNEIAALNKRRKGVATARDGVHPKVWEAYLKRRGFRRVECFAPGSPKIKLNTNDLPAGLTIIAEVSRHLVAVIDRRIHDTYDCSKNGERRVLAYWIKGN